MNVKPEYLYRPDQLLRRITTRRAPSAELRVVLPWGLPTVVSSGDVLGRGIIRRNVHELAVTEAMWRLTDPSDTAVDVGANAGYFTALLAFRAQDVLAFEPHPMLSARLRSVIDEWPAAYRSRVRLEEAGISDRSGTAYLRVPPDFAANEGLATLSPGGAGGEGVYVPILTLDEVVGNRRVGVMKIDIEGHELAAFGGARGLLERGLIRDVFFEEHAVLPTPVTQLLAAHGYALFGLRQRVRGVEVNQPDASQPRWEAPTYLATLDPGRVRARIRLNGWHSLRPRSLGLTRPAS